MKRIYLTWTVLCALPFASPGQGALNPTGAPAPSMRTLTQVEPRTPISAVPVTISVPGSYYFTTNLTGVSGTNGITVAANDVTLDLNGFALIGVTGATAGITSTATVVNFTLRNGTIRNWPASGIVAPGPNGKFEQLNVYSNSGAFALSAGPYARARQCQVALNAGGLALGPGGAVSDSVIRNNSSHGIAAGESAHILNCTIYSNSGSGLTLSNASVVESCVIKTNGQNGVVGLANLSLARCNISQNGSNGVFLTLGGRVTDCVISSNRVDGIRVTARSVITRNVCDFNGLTGKDAGIRLLSTDSRIEENDLTSNITGIVSDVGFNLIVRNRASLNATNYAFHASDLAGLVSASPINAGVWANFDY